MTTDVTAATFVKHSSGVMTFKVAVSSATLNGRTVSAVSAATVSGITISDVGANLAYTDPETCATVAANTGFTMTASGGTAGSDYSIPVTVTLSDGNAPVWVVVIQVRDS
tara:strand:- start:757 stop:1086 length:330 start_codon:yes stop_codon:yes gene_type:complete